MPGIYIHIPFCKQACHYCDFHFSTSTKKKDEMITAIITEIELRKNEAENQEVETIYFGGGTPSILEIAALEKIIQAIYTNFKVIKYPEITLEANPDDLIQNTNLENPKSIFESYREIGINRLSIGIQSFFEDDLKLMNRAHNAKEAKNCLQEATKYFDNISVDLIYGIPQMSNQKWLQNIETALQFNVKHISSYALTIEPKTAFQKFIASGKMAAPKEAVAQQHFEILVETLEKNGFLHYEVSNFGKENYFSKNNSSYWLGKKYLGFGPSAHSFNGFSRSWNVANNSKYIQQITLNNLPSETEILSQSDQYNEYIMTGLRTIWGINLNTISEKYGEKYKEYLLKNAAKFLEENLLKLENNIITSTKKGLFLIDGVAATLFFIE